MNKKGELNEIVIYAIIIIVIVVLVGGVAYLEETSVENECRDLCTTNGETYYKSSAGYRSNDVCLCKTAQQRIVDYVIG